MAIKSIFFSEFHYLTGPELVCQYPEHAIKDEIFKILSDYIIPKPELCGKLFSMRIGPFYMMGLPVEILNEKYERKALEFNCGIFVHNDDYTKENVPVCERILRKLATYFTHLELEKHFLWRTDKKLTIAPLLKQLFE